MTGWSALFMHGFGFWWTRVGVPSLFLLLGAFVLTFFGGASDLASFLLLGAFVLAFFGGASGLASVIDFFDGASGSAVSFFLLLGAFVLGFFNGASGCGSGMTRS